MAGLDAKSPGGIPPQPVVRNQDTPPPRCPLRHLLFSRFFWIPVNGFFFPVTLGRAASFTINV